MEPEIWMLTHTDTTMQLNLSMKLWVVPKHSTNIYTEITDFCVEQNTNQGWKKELSVTVDSSEL